VENYWHLGRWFRIPVSMHWTVLLTLPWLWLWMQSLVAAVAGFTAFLLLQIAHEAGHAAMARGRGLVVDGITLSGLHGETSHGYPRSERDDLLIAWSGVGAQALILVLALVARQLLGEVAMPVWLMPVVGPMLQVFTVWNIFLMIVALLPIGPMDGHRAWRLIPYLRKAANRRRASGKVVKLDPVRRRKLEQNSERIATDIISKLGKKK
jgi:Zn-dependent protease